MEYRTPEFASGPPPSREEIASLDSHNMSFDDDQHDEMGPQSPIGDSTPMASSCRELMML